jgi:hypothetical protein
MEEKFKILRVTITKDYLIPMHDDTITKINGWTLEQVIEDWFKRYPLDMYHATRDGHEIGHSERFIHSEFVDIPPQIYKVTRGTIKRIYESRKAFEQYWPDHQRHAKYHDVIAYKLDFETRKWIEIRRIKKVKNA